MVWCVLVIFINTAQLHSSVQFCTSFNPANNMAVIYYEPIAMVAAGNNFPWKYPVVTCACFQWESV